MIPSACQNQAFLHSSDVQAADHSRNALLVGQLSDALLMWISHAKELEEKYIDAQKYSIDHGRLLDVKIVHDEFLTEQESKLSFVDHFEGIQVAATRRVLQHLPEWNAKFAELDDRLSVLRQRRTDVLNALNSLDILYDVVGMATWSTVEDIVDVIPVIFRSFRSLWMSCTLFGAQYPSRFTRFCDFTIQKLVDRLRLLLDATSAKIFLRPDKDHWLRKTLLQGQDACVAIQESYYTMKVDAADAGGAYAHINYQVDDKFWVTDVRWLSERCELLIKLVNHLSDHQEKYETQMLMDIRAMGSLFDPREITHERLGEAINCLQRSDPVSIKAILARIDTLAYVEPEEVPTVFEREFQGNHLVLMVGFQPLVLFAIGGPLSNLTMKNLATELPRCTSTHVALSARKMPAAWVDLTTADYPCSVGAIEFRDHCCSADVGDSYFLLKLLDVVERSEHRTWKLQDTYAAMLKPPAPEYKAQCFHKFFFVRRFSERSAEDQAAMEDRAKLRLEEERRKDMSAYAASL